MKQNDDTLNPVRDLIYAIRLAFADPKVKI